MKTRPGKIVFVFALAGALLCSSISPQAQQATRSQPLAVRLHVPSLADSIDEIAGMPVQVLDARVLEVLGPQAVLVEPATNYRTLRGQRDRIIVFVAEGNKRGASELAIGSTVSIAGVARTLGSLQLTNEVPWPARLDRREINRLEVQGAVIAGSIQTAEGTSF